MADAPHASAVVADDNLMFVALLEPQLRRLGYDVRTLPAAAEAADMAALAQPEGAPPPELILVNLAAARFSATELIRACRARPGLAQAAILAYAGHVERHLLAAGRAAGADLVVPNSALRSSLPEVLEKVRRRRGAAAPQAETARETPDA